MTATPSAVAASARRLAAARLAVTATPMAVAAAACRVATAGIARSGVTVAVPATMATAVPATVAAAATTTVAAAVAAATTVAAAAAAATTAAAAAATSSFGEGGVVDEGNIARLDEDAAAGHPDHDRDGGQTMAEARSNAECRAANDNAGCDFDEHGGLQDIHSRYREDTSSRVN